MGAANLTRTDTLQTSIAALRKSYRLDVGRSRQLRLPAGQEHGWTIH